MPNAHPIRVIVVDDDPLVRSSLRLYFSSDEDIVVVGEAANGSEAVDLIERHLVDVVMADIHMPEMDGLTLLDRVRARSNPPVFIGMTALDSDETMLHILSHGGHGYVLKSSEPQFLIQAVKDAYKGGTTVSPQPASRLMQHLPQNAGRSTSRRSTSTRPRNSSSRCCARGCPTPTSPSAPGSPRRR